MNWGVAGFGIDQIATTLHTRALAQRPRLVLIAIYADDFPRSLNAHLYGTNKPAFKLQGGHLVPRTAADAPPIWLRWFDRHSFAWTAIKLASWRVAMTLPHGEWWELNRFFIQRMIDDCRAAGVEIVFVHVPSNRGHSFDSLGDYLADRHLTWIDPVVAHPRRPDGIYYPDDRHLNAAGHAWLATHIVERLRAERGEIFRAPR
jgi:hypothetical protein